MPPQSSSHKKVLGPILAVLVLAGLVFLGLKSAKEQPTPTPSLGDESPLVEWPSEQVKRESITDNSKGYEITGYYPVTKSDGITAIMRDFVADSIDTFKADTTAAGELPEGYRAMTLDISYEQHRNERADNYVFTVYSDTGGAHGLQATKTFSFGKTGEQVALDDLFTNGIQGLGTIADYVKKELLKREFADRAWISEGAAPSKDNYQNFVVEDEGVTFIFDPYQVAPYAAGKQMVTIPTTVFKSIANPELFR